MDKVQRSEAEWRERLTPEEYRVLREAGTEAPWPGEYTDARTEGVYRCRACGAELFRSHLGHVFEGEGYQVPTDQRWCINSVSLTLEPADGG